MNQIELVKNLKPCSRSRTAIKLALKFNEDSISSNVHIEAFAFLFTPATGSNSAQILLRLQKNVSLSSNFVTLKQNVEKHNKTMRLLLQSRDLIQENEEKLSIILSSIGNGVITTGTDGIINFVNSAALEMLQFDVNEIIGQPLHALIHHSQVDGSPYPIEVSPVTQAYT